MAEEADNPANPQPEPEAADNLNSSESSPASASGRIAAFGVDLALVITFHFFLAHGQWSVSAAFFIVYHTVSLSVWGCTLGKAVMALRVQKPDGERLNWKWALLRSTIGYLASAFLLLGFIHTFFDYRRRGWHDLLFGSEVVQQKGPLSFKQMVRLIDGWTERAEVWQKAALARYHRLNSLVRLLSTFSTLMIFAKSQVEKIVAIFWRWVFHPAANVSAPSISAPVPGAPAVGAVPAATAAPAAAAGAMGVITSTVTAAVLAGSTLVVYEVSTPVTLRPWDGLPTTKLTGDCRGTISPSATSGYEGDEVQFTINIDPPLDEVVTRVTTNNPLCMGCDAAKTGSGRFALRLSFGPGRATAKVEFVAYDQEGRIRCRGDSPELTLLGPKQR